MKGSSISESLFDVVVAITICLLLLVLALRALSDTEPAAAGLPEESIEHLQFSHTILEILIVLQLDVFNALLTAFQAFGLLVCAVGTLLTALARAIIRTHPAIMLVSFWLATYIMNIL